MNGERQPKIMFDEEEEGAKQSNNKSSIRERYACPWFVRLSCFHVARLTAFYRTTPTTAGYPKLTYG